MLLLLYETNAPISHFEIVNLKIRIVNCYHMPIFSTHPVVSFTAPGLASLFDPLLHKPQRTVAGGYA